MTALSWLVVSASVLAGVTGAWTPDRFIISFWVDPIVPPDQFPAQYELIAHANFTTLLGGFGALQPDDVKAQLAACEAVGLAAIPNACESGPNSPSPQGSCVGMESPALMGFQMVDEPQASQFPAVRDWAASVHERAPGALRFINLLPNYAPPSLLQTGEAAPRAHMGLGWLGFRCVPTPNNPAATLSLWCP